MGAANFGITEVLGEISHRLTEAAAIAKGAVACAEHGSEPEAVGIAMELDRLLNEAQTLYGAVCLMGRLERAGDRAAPR